MSIKKILTAIGAAAVFFSFYSCFPAISSSIESSRSEVVPVENILVLGLENSINSSAHKVGQASFTSSELNSGCGYDDAIAELKKIASKNGGNVIKITEQKNVSGLMEECISMKADIYYAENLNELRAAAETAKPAETVTTQVSESATTVESTGKEKPAEEAATAEAEPAKTEPAQTDTISHSGEYATLYVYRSTAFGFAINYDLQLDDEVICRVKAVWGQEVKVYKFGKHELWAETEAKVSCPIDIEPGKSYYVKCGVGMGLLVGRPTIKLVDEAIGKPEFIDVMD
jgi:hypothetical protein